MHGVSKYELITNNNKIIFMKLFSIAVKLLGRILTILI